MDAPRMYAICVMLKSYAKAINIKLKIKERIEYCEGQITWMANVNYHSRLMAKRIYQEQIEFLESLLK